MMILIIISLILLEILTIAVMRDFFRFRKVPCFIIALTVNLLLSICFWYFFLKSVTFRGYFDSPEHIWIQMYLTGMIISILIPRLVVIITHFTGKLLRSGKGGFIRWLSMTGIFLSTGVFLITGIGTISGRYNFRTEQAEIRIEGLNSSLDGLKIVHISDIHISSFYKKNELLLELMKEINKLGPDLIINTGDFVSYGWHEFGSSDTILSKAVSTYGNYAVLGNHDMGTYLPDSLKHNLEQNRVMIREKIKASGYHLLEDEHDILKIGNAGVAIIGVTTTGRHPDIIHGDLKRSMTGTDGADLKILLCHDPNQWDEEVAGNTDIVLTLSGHTHGMQMGILTKKFRWSPSKYYYPNWNGLYEKGGQYLYVNRGLGVLAIPFRIWMPPEITVLTLISG